VGQSLGEEVSGTNLTHSAQGLHLPVQWTLKRACFTRSFWWAGLIFFSHGFLINMLVVHQAIYVVDKGYSPLLAAILVGLVGLLGSVGGIFFGFFSDRAGREVSFTAGTGAAFLGVLLLILLKDTSPIWMLYAFAILYGLGVGGMNPTTATTIGDLFPGNSLGRILSIMTMKFGFGGALGAFVGGYFYDKMGSYFIPFLLLLVSIVIGNIAIWMAAPRIRHPL
jgi:MFS family permease